MVNKIILVLLLSLQVSVEALPVIEENGVLISKQELSNAVKYMPSSMKVAAIEDKSVRMDILGQILENKKLKILADKISPEADEDFYWKRKFALRKMSNEMYLKYYESKLEIPKLDELARELFYVNKDSYGEVAEKRESSHILFSCPAGSKDCDRKDLRKKVEKVLSALENGEKFEEMVEKYSDDMSSKSRKGKLAAQYTRGAPRVDGHFLAGLFSIKNVGDYSGVVETRFGFHIIRLDAIVPKTYKEYDEVKPALIEAITTKYKKLSLTNYRKSLQMGSEVKIDEVALDNVFEGLKNSMNEIKKN